MPFVEIGILVLIFIFSLWLIRRSFDSSLALLLILSVFLHKEFFSIYTWDLVPVRVFMLAFVANAVLEVLYKMKRGLKPNIKTVTNFLLDPFLALISAYW